jgi:multidrug resistance efflux pump
MLNISEHRINHKVERQRYGSLDMVEKKVSSKVLRKLFGGSFILFIILIFLPWTQNIRSNGQLTTLDPSGRPQTIHSVISGRIEKWYVQEGQLVKKGDTIAFLSEIKDNYFDPELLNRTKNQSELKEQTVVSYGDKIAVLENQMAALNSQRMLKLEQGRIKLQQAHLKVSNDSIALKAAEVTYITALDQYDRIKQLYDQGLKSLTELENRDVKKQDAFSYKIAAENKYLASKSDLIAAKIELSNIQLDYETSIAKTNSDKFTALSSKLDSEGSLNKLLNEFANYEKRASFYYIIAPQDCYVTKLIANGIGEIVKEGEPVVSIMPEDYELAVEVYVEPVDLPLIKVGEKVRLQFDGWPAIVFSGWPNASYGTFGGVIYAIDQYISENGKYRILVKQDKNDQPWPEALRFGGGTNALILLDDVPIWYELWRKTNGFPPNYYQAGPNQKTSSKK